MSGPHVPFPLTASLSATSFQLAPLASNSSLGWAPSCTTSACASNATWFTGAAGSTLSYEFWGWDVALDGSVQGDMNIQATVDGKDYAWNPSNGNLLTVQSLEFRDRHTVSLKVINASSNALLSVNQARINGSTGTTEMFINNQWLINSDNPGFSYTGFVEQVTNTSGTMSPVNRFSNNAGDKATYIFNGTACAIYGPCGPSSGMMRVDIDEKHEIVNISKPLQADDCMLYQSNELPSLQMHNLVITNEDGRPLGFNRVEFIIVKPNPDTQSPARAGMIAGIVAGVVVLIALGIITYSMRSQKTRKKIGRSFSLLCS